MNAAPLPALIRRCRRLRWLAFLAAAALVLGGCHGKRLTRANVAEVSDGMTRKQVESILGPPTSIDSTDLLILKKVTYSYQQANESVTIVFTNDKVTSKESTLRD